MNAIFEFRRATFAVFKFLKRLFAVLLFQIQAIITSHSTTLNDLLENTLIVLFLHKHSIYSLPL